MNHKCHQEIEYEELATLPLPPARKRFVPISHKSLYDRAVNNLSMLNYEPIKPKFLVNNNKLKFIATFGIKQKAEAFSTGSIDQFVNDDYQFEVGLINSNDSSMSAKLFTGTRVFVCANGQWSGEVVLSRKHTRNAGYDINKGLRDFAFELENTRKETFEAFNKLKEYDFDSKTEVHDFIVETCKRDILPWQHAPKVLEHWEHPEHPEFEPRNAYSLFNAFSSWWRTTNQFTLVEKTTKLRNYIDEYKQPNITTTQPRPNQIESSSFPTNHSTCEG